jgi:hypothetical protein
MPLFQIIQEFFMAILTIIFQVIIYGHNMHIF